MSIPSSHMARPSCCVYNTAVVRAELHGGWLDPRVGSGRVEKSQKRQAAARSRAVTDMRSRLNEETVEAVEFFFSDGDACGIDYEVDYYCYSAAKT